jgi:predicted  nucleic acid-binding Zn-ribbon protein
VHKAVKVENEVGLYRDLSSGAIVNTDDSGRNAYLKQRKALLKAREETEQNTRDIQELKGEVQDIKQMLSQILAHVQK